MELDLAQVQEALKLDKEKDDESMSGYETHHVNYSLWTVPQRYRDLTRLGSGAYAQVCSAYDRKLNKNVAMKKLTRPLKTVDYARRALRELKLMKHFCHENIISIIDVFTPLADEPEDMEEIYFVVKKADGTLDQVLKTSNDDGTKLNEETIQYLVYQMVRALKHIHSANVMHRDLKPDNIGVLENDGLIQILDFGLARHVDSYMSGYVMARWYRAPEIILRWMRYNEKADIWSLGCIFSEMMTGKPLFPVDCWQKLLDEIINLCGTPSDSFIDKIEGENIKKCIRGFTKVEKKDLTQIHSGFSSQAVDLVEKMLKIDPDERISVDDAIKHPFFGNLRDPENEPTARPFVDNSEGLNLSIADLRREIWREIHSFNPRSLQSIFPEDFYSSDEFEE